MSIMERLKFRKKTVPIGLYAYRGEGEFAGLALQLRVELGGVGLLVINANTVLYLNETAVAHAYFFMKGMTTHEAISNVRKMYRVKEKDARVFHEKMIYTISTLARTEDVCPISFLDVERMEPFSQDLSAPVRMDLALTYRCQNDCTHCYIGGPRQTRELDTAQWKQIIDKLCGIGIFILTFTGGEPTLREDLPELLGYAQNKGVVTGLVTNGRLLKDLAYVQKLSAAGLDFAQITLESHEPKVHDSITSANGSWKETVQGIKNAVQTPIYTTTNTTLNTYNAASFLKTVEFLHGLGVKAFGCNSLIYSGKGPKIAGKFALSIEELKQLLPLIQEKASELGMKFMWYTPTQYCQLDPVSLDLGIKSCSAARINMCVGPEGEVYPCQSYFESVGNLLRDDWQKIWNNVTCKNIRAKEFAPEKCRSCEQFDVCGGGCPLELKENTYVCAEAQ